MDENQIRVLQRARPLRVAYFVDLAETSHPILDAVFTFSFTLWAGRFSLIVPFQNGAPVQAFMPWLKAYDPDIIYSYVDLASEQQREFHEILYPAVLQRHWDPPNGAQPNPHPNLSVTPLGVSTVIPLLGTPNIFHPNTGIRLVSAMGTLERDPFLRNSFGIVDPSIRMQLQSHLRNYGSMVFAIADGEHEPRGRSIRPTEQVVSNISAVLDLMTNDRGAIGLTHLSAVRSPRLDLRTNKWSDSFNVVIGDTVSDRIAYWNSRALMSPWRDGSDVDLYLPTSALDNPEISEALQNYLHKRNSVNGDTGNGSPRITFRSVSIDEDVLETFSKRLNSSAKWIVSCSERLSSVTDCIPDETLLKNASFTTGEAGVWATRKLWAETYSGSSKLRLTAETPEHLRHAPTALLNGRSGAWAVDLDIDRSINHSPYSNVRHRWRFPRRLRVTRAFVGNYELKDSSSRYTAPRVSNGGMLTLFANADSILPTIYLEEDSRAIITGLVSGNDWASYNWAQNSEPLSQKSYHATRSSAGQYFWGVYQMFGSLNGANNFLLNEYWRQQLTKLGALSQKSEKRLGGIQELIERKFGGQTVDMRNPKNTSILTNIIQQEVQNRSSHIPYVSWEALCQDFAILTAKHEEAHPVPRERSTIQEQASSPMDFRYLRSSVQNLCRKGILHQGYEYFCAKCLHRNWCEH